MWTEKVLTKQAETKDADQLSLIDFDPEPSPQKSNKVPIGIIRPKIYTLH